MSSLIIIPARIDSKRLPGKPLLEAGGKTLLQHTYERAKMSRADRVLVATPDPIIVQHCVHNFMSVWCNSASEAKTGTERCYETIRDKEIEADVVVNLQVDEPCVSVLDLNRLLDSKEAITTLVSFDYCSKSKSRDHVRAIVRVDRRCLWFTREPIDFAYKHIGVYAFRKTLPLVGRITPTDASRGESLEQLAWLENGYGIIAIATIPTAAINTQEDWDAFKKELQCPASKS